MKMKEKLILASGSPRRREILSMAGYDFDVICPDAEEIKDGDAVYLTEENSKRKAGAALKLADGVILCADTVVLIDGEILGKPHTEEKAVEMLRNLSGKTHTVITGYTVTDGKTTVTGHEKTDVQMRNIPEKELLSYVKICSPLDKAGAYGIQEVAGMFVSALHGDFYNVVGLPLCAISEILRDKFNISPFDK